MLAHLHIRNLALVPSLDLEFGPGFNVITGETGAGKSLIIGAVQLLAGGRATPSLIRKGASNCEIAGAFTISPDFEPRFRQLARQLEEHGIPPCEEGTLLLRRVITETGSRAYINGAMATAGLLKEITASLVDLHGPHDNQTLLSPAHQEKLLDIYGGLQKQRTDTSQAWKQLCQIQNERAELTAAGMTPEELALLQYQWQEIEDARIQPDEEEDLLQQYRVASSAQALAEAAANAQQAICGMNDEAIADKLANQLRSLRDLETVDPRKGGALVRELENLTASLQEVGNALGEYAETMDCDPGRLQELEEKMDLLQKLKRKYGPTLQDVCDTQKRIAEKIRKIQGRTDRLASLEAEETKAKSAFQNACRELSGKRKAIAPRLAAAIGEKLRHLGFLQSEFAISCTPCTPGATGADLIAFRFAPNAGEDCRDLKEIASSGEIARVMLAIKTVLSDADEMPVLIFDEIDANIGGRVAVTVAEELRSVARRHQVFSITHLPQIAAAGNTHYLVEKHISEEERTITDMRLLSPKERGKELVRMLGADQASTAAREHARDLLQMFAPSPG